MMLLKNDRVAGEEKECACVQGEGGGGGGGGGWCVNITILFFVPCKCVFTCVYGVRVRFFLFCFFLLASLCIDDLLFRRGYYALML